MPRDSAGNYNLVAGNPVQSGEVISSSWANNTLDDVALALTDSLDRNGRGGMLAPFRFADGTNLLPGASWVNETTTGFYRFDGGDLRVSVLTQDVMRWQTSGVQIWNDTDMEWENVLTGGANGSVQDGTADGQTLRWEADNSRWEATSLLAVSDDDEIAVSGPIRVLSSTSAFAATGNPLIYATDGTGTAPFDLTGNLVIQGRENASRSVTIATGNPSESRLTVDAAGNVGIGNATPAYRLDMSGVSNATDSYLMFLRNLSDNYALSIGPYQFDNTAGGGAATINYRFTIGGDTLWTTDLFEVSNDLAAVGGQLRLHNTATSMAAGNNAGAIEFWTVDASSGTGVVCSSEAETTNAGGLFDLVFSTGTADS